MSFEKKYPNLFNEVTWPWGPTRARFKLIEDHPPSHLIANINIIPKVGKSWLMLHHQDSSWDIPGGTVEKDEYFMDTSHRELIEEAGASLKSFSLFGAWDCISLASKPYRPHLPHPEFYRIVGIGDVEITQLPTNPANGEKIISVESVSLANATERFNDIGRYDLSELYQLAADISQT